MICLVFGRSPQAACELSRKGTEFNLQALAAPSVAQSILYTCPLEHQGILSLA